ncbi:olfactory receptor 52P1-like [Hemicordylus capensis]|uniref:olfactory receptor 52P1-like n=1 Tax=Hemicordylus capensis TaxID=884348 RepID=UPI0023022035|nr:olfactory receptor 52P1-like [Hemicordylus capensis]XP_053167958.1 olfactory receptor 52P1-like [Hemicordylus capensis]
MSLLGTRTKDHSEIWDASNISNHIASSSFFLLGLPGLEKIQVWLSIPFCFIYATALLGNATLLWVIWTEPSLHKPMYLFLSMLALTDMALPTCILPKMLAIFWVGSQGITFAACLVQMFMIHALCAVESGTLTAMAYDRYVAVCFPLSYSSLLTANTVIKLGAIIAARALVIVLPFPFLVKRLPFCHSHLISHSYCEHMAVVKLACGDTTPNNLYGLILSLVIVGADLSFIFISYGLILHAVFRLPSLEARHKALGTCGAHVGVIVILYTPGLFSFLTHRFGHSVPHHVHIFLANIYLMVPAMLNPIVYGAKTKQIRGRVLRALRLGKSFS